MSRRRRTVVDIDRVDRNDHRFRYTLDSDTAGLERSIRTYGITTPLMLVEESQKFIPVTGFARLHAATAGGTNKVLAYVAPKHSRFEALLRFSVDENCAVRELTAAEKAKVIGLLAKRSIAVETISNLFSTLLKLPLTANLIGELVKISRLPPELADYAHRKRVPLKTLRTLAALDNDTIVLVNSVVSELTPTASLLREIASGLGAVAKEGRREPAAVAATLALSELIKGPADTKTARLERFRNILWETQFPTLERTNRSLRDSVRELALPPAVRVGWDRTLEQPGATIRVDIERLGEFRNSVASLARADVVRVVSQILDAC